MDLFTCDRGAPAPSTQFPHNAQPGSKEPNGTVDADLNVTWTGLVSWLGAGLSATSLVQESDR